MRCRDTELRPDAAFRDCRLAAAPQMPYSTLRFQRGDFDSGIVSKPTKPVRLGIVGCGAVVFMGSA